MRVYQDFQDFADKHGFPISQEFLIFFKMGSNVTWDTMPYLAWSARALSIVWQGVPAPALDSLRYDTPLWHFCLFRNNHKLSYYSPALIRAGITTVGLLLEDDSSLTLIGPSWRDVYCSAINHWPSDSSQLDDPPLPHTISMDPVDLVANG